MRWLGCIVIPMISNPDSVCLACDVPVEVETRQPGTPRWRQNEPLHSPMPDRFHCPPRVLSALGSPACAQAPGSLCLGHGLRGPLSHDGEVSDMSDRPAYTDGVPTVTAREASRKFSALLDHVEHDGEEYVIVRDGKEVARIIPAGAHTLGAILDALDEVPALDPDFEGDALGANDFLTTPSDPWRD